MYEPLGDIIRRRRVQRNLSQEALAKRAGVSRRHLAFVEKNEANVSVKVIVKIATALELTELAVGALCLRAAPPELPSLLDALDTVADVRRDVAQVSEDLAAFDTRLAGAARLIERVVVRALASAGSGREAIDAALRQEEDGTSSVTDALRDLAAPPRVSIPAIRRRPAPAVPAARKKAR